MLAAEAQLQADRPPRIIEARKQAIKCEHYVKVRRSSPYLWAAVLAVCTFCAAIGVAAPEQLTLSIERHRSLDDLTSPKPPHSDWLVRFTPLPLGHFWGQPIAGIEVRPATEGWVTLHAAALERLLANLQVLIPPDASLTVRPKACKFFRIGTFVTSISADQPADAGVDTVGLIDRRNGEFLLLAHFDRPCTVTGNNQANGETFRFDVQVHSAGFHWLNLAPRGDGQFDVFTAERGIEPTLVVQSP